MIQTMVDLEKNRGYTSVNTMIVPKNVDVSLLIEI